MKETPCAEYMIRVGRLSWPELWILGGRSPFGLALLAPSKLLGSRRFDRAQRMQFDRPLGVGLPRPLGLSEAATARCFALEQAGFTYWGAIQDETLAVSLASYRQGGTLAQIADGPATAPIVALFSFTRPRLTITADGETGIRGGACVDKVVLWGAPIAKLLAQHRHRSDGCSTTQLSEDFVVRHLAAAARAAFDYNVARGVYQISQKS